MTSFQDDCNYSLIANNQDHPTLSSYTTIFSSFQMNTFIFRLCQTHTCINILASDTGKHVLINNINNHDNKLLILKTLTQDQFCLVINCIFPKQIAILTRLCLLTMLNTNKTIQFYGP